MSPIRPPVRPHAHTNLSQNSAMLRGIATLKRPSLSASAGDSLALESPDSVRDPLLLEPSSVGSEEVAAGAPGTNQIWLCGSR